MSTRETPETPAPAVWIGIDVAKAELVVAERPSGVTWSVATTDEALAALAADLQARAPERVVLEATGGYERPIVAALAAVELPVAVVNPRRIRQFAQSVGRLAKTDAIDAAVLAHYAEAIQPPVRGVQDAATQELDAWIERRRQVTQTLVAERQRQKTAHPSLRPRVERHIAWLEEELKALEQAIAEQLAESSTWAPKVALLTSVPGIGLQTAAVLLAEVPEIGQIDAKGLASLVGVAPLNRDSGTQRGKRSIWGGRASVRTALYMPTLTASRSNAVIRAFRQRLQDAGKAPKVVRIACMRKLLTICNAILASGEPWKEPASAAASA